MAERYTVTSNSSSNTRLEEAEFEKIQLLAATKAELETKNSGGSPMDTGELAVATDTKSLWHRFSGPDVRKIPFLDGSGNALGTNALDIQSSRSAATQVASGTNSSAIGSRNTASGSNSSAIGYDNTASGTNSSAIGYDNIASGYGSSAIGSRNTASGDDASAIGYDNTASGFASSAIGYDNTASGHYSSAIGCDNTASGERSSAFGFRTTTTVNATFEAGYWSNASTRAGAIRTHSTGQVSATLPTTDTAFTASAAANGSEVNGSLAQGMFSTRLGGTDDELITEVNDTGTIRKFSQLRIESNGAVTGGDLSGNARGANALDIQSSRSAATQVASGTNSSAIGSRNTASENYSSAIGYDNTASGTNSSAIGSRNTASGNNLSAIGYDNIASGYGSSAIGSRNTASGNYSSAFGYQNTASGYYSSAFGYDNTASGTNSSAIGSRNTASGYYSSAFGYRTTTTVNETFEAGYWSNASTRSTAVRLHPNGQVAMTIEDSATAPTDGGATAGSEADGTLGRGMFAIQKNGTALTLYYNNAGTIQSVSLGTLS